MQREPWASHKAACDAAEQGGRNWALMPRQRTRIGPRDCSCAMPSPRCACSAACASWAAAPRSRVVRLRARVCCTDAAAARVSAAEAKARYAGAHPRLRTACPSRTPVPHPSAALAGSRRRSTEPRLQLLSSSFVVRRAQPSHPRPLPSPSRARGAPAAAVARARRTWAARRVALRFPLLATKRRKRFALRSRAATSTKRLLRCNLERHSPRGVRAGARCSPLLPHVVRAP
jgi:hypothetical protein